MALEYKEVGAFADIIWAWFTSNIADSAENGLICGISGKFVFDYTYIYQS